ncbi:hypothetical protein B0J12DRAFT_327684 [Macrophomina phaseolina]|uniref:Uncharacterized protein n=1 Tax=Macrophomina phaseolina TaxID=35725 RepID=A0ABQ8FV85_9PEZI|nr:hypothetical protein B0J12DRAFT_327684 [Macrophomina phaseolina]
MMLTMGAATPPPGLWAYLIAAVCRAPARSLLAATLWLLAALFFLFCLGAPPSPPADWLALSYPPVTLGAVACADCCPTGKSPLAGT